MSLTNKSYTEITEADAYWGDRNDDTWADASEAEKTAALIRATEWIDGRFDWVGEIATTDQVLRWPRLKAYDSEGILREGVPREVKNAVSWLAREGLTGEIDPAQDRGGSIKAVEAGSVSVEWNQNAPTGKSYRHVRTLLRGLIRAGGMRRG